MRMKRWLIASVILLAVLLVAKHLLLDTPAEPRGQYAIDLEALHRAATATPGPLPQGIEVERVGDFAFPETLVLAGHGFHMHKMVLLAHRVVWPDHAIVVDTAMSPEAAKKMPGSKVDTAAFARVEKAIATASAIVFTHEHVDHVGGVASAPDFAAIAKNVRMTSEQLSGRLERDEFPPGALDRLVPLSYESLHTLAPGVVLQKAPGHSPGSQLVYVELASGARFLFVGDIAWSYDNVREQTGRPGLVTLLAKEDRPAVAAQLRAIAALPPDVHVIVAHDPVTLERDLAAHLYRSGFTVD